MSKKRGTVAIPISQSLISQAKNNVDAQILHAIDRDELRRMLRTTEDRLWKLKSRMPVSRRGRGRKKRSISQGSYAKKIAEYELLVASLKEAIAAHEEILLVAKGIQPQRFMSRVLSFFTYCINKLCVKWYILEEWYKDARNILANIKRRAENLQHFRFARV